MCQTHRSTSVWSQAWLHQSVYTLPTVAADMSEEGWEVAEFHPSCNLSTKRLFLQSCSVFKYHSASKRPGSGYQCPPWNTITLQSRVTPTKKASHRYNVLWAFIFPTLEEEETGEWGTRNNVVTAVIAVEKKHPQTGFKAMKPGATFSEYVSILHLTACAQKYCSKMISISRATSFKATSDPFFAPVTILRTAVDTYPEKDRIDLFSKQNKLLHHFRPISWMKITTITAAFHCCRADLDAVDNEIELLARNDIIKIMPFFRWRQIKPHHVGPYTYPILYDLKSRW